MEYLFGCKCRTTGWIRPYDVENLGNLLVREDKASRMIKFSFYFLSLDTRNWTSGMYVIQILGKNTVLETKKIEIIH